ncbi:hypothetical protein CCAX7_000670 [Capsulimonas corticalis]|uniref:Uncharacterized protein n=1 Tax=Capsulimonas corticalis TaxID=2219043 RepID=A0A402CRE9_9BACT|nr:hypothetical protein [Capsulimonas corticalis]BDI28016.1 hypothetical protein CCAX7_000670 [Capsulimonas corticalis]
MDEKSVNEQLHEMEERQNRTERLLVETIAGLTTAAMLYNLGSNEQYYSDDARSLRSKLYGRNSEINWDIAGELSNRLRDIMHDVFNTTQLSKDNYPRLSSGISETRGRLHILQTEIHAYLAATSTGIDPNLLRVSRFLKVTIYLPDGLRGVPYAEETKIAKAVRDLMESIGFYVSDDFDPKIRSWYKKFFAKSKESLTHPEVVSRLKKIEYGLEKYALQERQANIDEKQANAVAALIKALENQPSVIGRIGSIVLVKYCRPDGQPMIEFVTLTTDELMFVEEHGHQMKDPAEFIAIIERQRRATKSRYDHVIDELDANDPSQFVEQRELEQ